METQSKLEMLAAAAEFDVCGYCATSKPPKSPLSFIHQAYVPGKGTVSLLKVLLTNYCINDCIYCVNQAGRDIVRSAFQSEELAGLFMGLYEKRLVKGLFLSSGIAVNASRTMSAMLDTVAILRKRYGYRGYIHLKIMPGAPPDCIEEGCRLSSRVSVNIEAPTAKRLAALTSGKDLYRDILRCMQKVRELEMKGEGMLSAGQTTQFVVGAAGESDRELIRMGRTLYREIGLRRIYFSAYKPVTKEGGMSATPSLREHRLYQIDWLMRVYGFPPEEVELALDSKGSLSLAKNPKLVIALRQPGRFPVDINRADYEELIRVPGIGPLSAKRITQARKEHSINSMGQLKKIGVLASVAAPFIRFKGMTGEEREAGFSRVGL